MKIGLISRWMIKRAQGFLDAIMRTVILRPDDRRMKNGWNVKAEWVCMSWVRRLHAEASQAALSMPPTAP